MLNKPLVSIIIPVYNVEKYLRRCLDSVLNQSYKDWEAICVNDGSPDNSAKILAEYAERDARFKIINKENGGLSDARNVGLSFSKGEFILYLDSDDFIHPQTLEITVALAEKNNADMVLFQYDLKFFNKAKEKINNKNIFYTDLPQSRNIVYNTKKIHGYYVKNILFHCTERNRSFFVRRPVRRHCFVVLGLYRKNLLKDMSFIKGIIMEDFPWWSELLLKRPITIMTRLPLYFYMPNATSILNSSKALRMIESITSGIERVYSIYLSNASYKEQKYYKKEFLWPFIIIAMRKVKDLDNRLDLEVAVRAFSNLYNLGVFNDPPNFRSKKYFKRIKKLIKNEI